MNFEFPSIFPVTCHTRHVGPGSTFVAIPGEKQHGEFFIQEALVKGATTIVIDRTSTQERIPGIVYKEVTNTHQALGYLSAQALGNPAHKLSVIGVTGTKGKTTTCSLIFHMLQKAGFKVGLIGSVENKLDTFFSTASSQTTPTADYLHMFFAQAVKLGITHVVMEVSSHALFYKKLESIPLDLALFTNFDHDHLDFHKTVDQYFKTKLQIFDYLKLTGKALINADDRKSPDIINFLTTHHANKKSITVGSKKNVSKRYRLVKKNIGKITIRMHKNYFSLSLPGVHNAQNLALALVAVEQYQIPSKTIEKALQTFAGIPGRTEQMLFSQNKRVIIDFAHNPSSMHAVLSTLAEQTRHLIVIFGCGGDRDPSKRPLMGTVAKTYAHKIIITNDNPRTENPNLIVNDILKNYNTHDLQKVQIELDRKQAIAYGLSLLPPTGILAILGRGHEKEQLINNQRIALHDPTVVKELSSIYLR